MGVSKMFCVTSTGYSDIDVGSTEDKFKSI